ncbi:MAG: MBL fold metallo-hydrolase [Bacteroidia bacterium]|nr:MBL fold metallo-hydrolase [Bacteroidia bacterium]
MKVKFLGTGGAFDFDAGNSSIWIEINNKKFLLDCGHTVYPALRKHNLIDDLDYILISHFHDDHVGSLCTTILHHTFFLHKPKKTKIIFPDESFKYNLNKFLSFGLGNVDEFVDFIPISETPEVKAINTFGLHVENMQSYGFIFEDENEIVAISGDLGDPEIIFSCVSRHSKKKLRIFHEMSFEHTDGVHSYYKDLFFFLDDYEIYGYHVNPEQVPADNQVPLVADHPEYLL